MFIFHFVFYCLCIQWLKTVAVSECEIMYNFCCQNYKYVLTEVWGQCVDKNGVVMCRSLLMLSWFRHCHLLYFWSLHTVLQWGWLQYIIRGAVTCIVLFYFFNLQYFQDRYIKINLLLLWNLRWGEDPRDHSGLFNLKREKEGRRGGETQEKSCRYLIVEMCS